MSWNKIIKTKYIDIWQDRQYTYIKFFDGLMKCQLLNKEAKEFIDFIKKDVKKINIDNVFDGGVFTKWMSNNKLKMESGIRNLNYDICPLCNKPKDLIPHHERYVPEKTKDICQSCHIKIHRSLDYHPELRPKGVQGNKWNHYKNGKPKPPASGLVYRKGAYEFDFSRRVRRRKK